MLTPQIQERGSKFEVETDGRVVREQRSILRKG